MPGKVRHGDNASRYPAQRNLGSGFRSGSFGRVANVSLDLFERQLAEQALHRIAQLAGELERDADAGLIDAGFDRAEGLARDRGTPREFRLAYLARDSGGSDSISKICHGGCHVAIMMA